MRTHSWSCIHKRQLLVPKATHNACPKCFFGRRVAVHAFIVSSVVLLTLLMLLIERHCLVLYELIE